MNAAVNTLYTEYLEHTGGDKAAAASLALAAVLQDSQAATVPTRTPADIEPALTVAQAANRLGVVPKTVYEMCQHRRLHSFRPGAGRVLRIPAEEIERLENESEAGVQAPRLPDLVKRHF